MPFPSAREYVNLISDSDEDEPRCIEAQAGGSAISTPTNIVARPTDPGHEIHADPSPSPHKWALEVTTPTKASAPQDETPSKSAELSQTLAAELSIPAASNVSVPVSVRLPHGLRTPQKTDSTVDKVAGKLSTFIAEVDKFHSRDVHYTLQETSKKALKPRHLSSVDVFADMPPISADPVSADSEGSSEVVMSIKFKQHNTGRDHVKARRLYFPVDCIKPDKERVPKYRFHHMEIAKNILTPNTMLKFVPHLRDLNDKEEKRYFVWLKELESMDTKSGFSPQNRIEKMMKSRKNECAATLYMFLDRWIKVLGIDGCNKSTLIRYMARQSEKDDAITPQQKNSLLDSYSDGISSPQTREAARLFTKAFDQVFGHRATLRDILMLDESVETIVDNKRVKDAPGSQRARDEELLLGVEKGLLTYSVLGCLICYSHECEHGEYDWENQKRTFSIDSLGRFLPLLKRRWQGQLRSSKPASGEPSKPASQLCRNQCFRSYDVGNPAAPVVPWSDAEVELLKAAFAILGHSSLKPQCAAACLLGRKCWDVYRKLKELNLSLPPVEHPREVSKSKPQWYDNKKKVLSGDWQEQTISHEHARRELFDPCHHDGPCSAANKCPCAMSRLLCERFCQCTADSCSLKFTGCACHSSGKTCHQRQREGKPCICVQLNRECDPVLCKVCGARERADLNNAHDDVLHSTGCQNVALQRGVAKAVVMGKSQLEACGYGLFAAEDIAQDEFVIEYIGELITHDEGVRREARRGDVFDEGSNSSYLFTLLEQEGIWVDAAIYGNLSRYINHAYEGDKKGCNVMPKILYVNGEFRIRFTALRDIKPGDELFFNYGENFPNLTKKLLDDKEAEENGEEVPAPKRKPGRPPRENGRGAARKTTKARGKVSESGLASKSAGRSRGGGGKARKEAPRPGLGEDVMNWQVDAADDEDDGDHNAPDGELGDDAEQSNVATRRSRRGARRRLRDDDGYEDYDEYQPVINDSQDEAGDSAPAEPHSRLRQRRARAASRSAGGAGDGSGNDAVAGPGNAGADGQTQPVKRPSGRGGARPGAGRKRKRPRPAAIAAAAARARMAELAAAGGAPLSEGDRPVSETVDAEEVRVQVQGTESVEVGSDGENASDRGGDGGGDGAEQDSFDEDDEDEDEDDADDVVDRRRRKRQKPLRYRADQD